MANFTLPQQTCPADQESDSPSATVPSKPTRAVVTLTSSQWANPALAGNRVLWGIQLSTDGGTTWGPGTCSSASNTIGGASTSVPAWAYQTDTIGHLSKDGTMPAFAFSGGDMPPAGARVRLFAWPEVAISLGATLTLT